MEFSWSPTHKLKFLNSSNQPILPDVRDPMEQADKAGLLDPMTHIPEETSGWDATF
jgi:hypothetical protein